MFVTNTYCSRDK